MKLGFVASEMFPTNFKRLKKEDVLAKGGKWETCRECSQEFGHFDANSLSQCFDCRAKAKEATQAACQMGTCQVCGTTFRYRADKGGAPKFCKTCHERRKTDWLESICEDCGESMRIHRDWESPPTVCRECKDARASQWIERTCDDCSATYRVHQDWSNPPSVCKSCKEERASKWYDKSCEECGATIKAHTDWDHPPRFCKSCKEDRDASRINTVVISTTYGLSRDTIGPKD